MPRLLLILLLFISVSHAKAQHIEYSKPQSVADRVSEDDYKRIADLSIDVVKTRFEIDSVTNGSIFLHPNDKMSAFNLDNLVLKCLDAKSKNKWPQVVKTHFNALFSSMDQEKGLQTSNYEAIKQYLSLRIYNASTYNDRTVRKPAVSRVDLEGTFTVLMLDLETAFTSVDPKDFAGWNKDTAEIFAIAQSNINKQKVEKITKTFKIEGNELEVSFIGNEDYAASYALDLERNSPQLVGEWGSVLAMPNKGIVDICKVSKAHPVDFVTFIKVLKDRVEQSFAEHPQPISNQFFWYYKGRFTKIDVQTKPNGQLSVTAPVEMGLLMSEKQ